MKLNISPELQMPLEWAQMATIVYGTRGTGKTTFGSVAAEEVWKQRVRFCAIDVKGDWWGLKSSADGKAPGIPVVIFGGDHADVPLEENAGAQVASIIAALEQPVIIDLEQLSKARQIHFLAAFFERLYDVNRDPLLLLLDEIQRYAPQNIRFATPDISMCLGAVEDLVKLGRKHGLGVIGFTQRGSGVNKEISELCDVLAAFRTPGPLDQGRVRDWLEANVTEQEQKTVMAAIAGLETGTCIIASGHPQLKVFKTVAVRRRETFDSSATPKIGKRRAEPKVLAKPDLEKLRAQMATAIDRAKAEDPKALQVRIRELERQLTAKRVETKVEQHVREVQVRVEVPVLKDGQLARLEKALERGAGIAKVIQSGLAELAPLVAKAAQPITIPQHQPGPTPAVSRRPSVVATPRSLAPRAAQGKEQRQGPGTLDSSVKIGQGERKVLTVLAQWPDGRTPKDLAFLAGYSAKASTIGVILSKLRQAGLVEPAEKGQPVRATEAGIAEAGGAEELPTGPALLAHWMGHPRIGEGERKVLRALIDAYPDALTHEELCERTNYSPIASTMGVILSKLRKLGLVEAGARRIPASLYEAISEEVA